VATEPIDCSYTPGLPHTCDPKKCEYVIQGLERQGVQGHSRPRVIIIIIIITRGVTHGSMLSLTDDNG
jgi:hypothetical protein